MFGPLNSGKIGKVRDDLGQDVDVSWTIFMFRPDRSISAPMTLEFTFSEEVIGEPAVELWEATGDLGGLVPLSILRREGPSMTVRIIDPPLTPEDCLILAAYARSTLFLRVTCVECRSK
jgi:hypothetical protein